MKCYSNVCDLTGIVLKLFVINESKIASFVFAHNGYWKIPVVDIFLL